MSAFDGFTGRVDSPLSLQDEIDAVESLVRLIGAAGSRPEHGVYSGVALLSDIVADRLDQIRDLAALLCREAPKH